MNSNEKWSFWLNVLVLKLKLKLKYWFVTCVVINVDKKRILFLFYHLYKCKNLSCCVLLIKRNVMHFIQINNQKILWFMIKSRFTAFWDWAAFRVFVWTDVAVRIIAVHISSSIISTEIVVLETTCHLWPYHAGCFILRCVVKPLISTGVTSVTI